MMISQIMALRKVTKKQLADSIAVSYPTLRKLLHNPKLLNVYQREQIAKTLGIKLIMLDCIISIKATTYKHWTTILSTINDEHT